MGKFEDASRITLAHEGGYSNYKDDRGGETYSGISRKFHPDWVGWPLVDKEKMKPGATKPLDVRLAANLKVQQAIERFYKREYWDRLRLDKCPDQDIANELFDTAVNQGVKTAAKYLQRCLNLLNRDQRDYADIKVDGMVGPNTIKTLKKALSKGERWKIGLLKSLNGEQYIRYRVLALFNSKQEKFFHGWLKRVTFVLTR